MLNEWKVEKNKAAYLSPPTEEVAARSEAQFHRYGLSGCVPEADGVHMAWPACPCGLQNLHIWQEGCTTHTFNVSVGLTRAILHTTGGHPGVRLAPDP